MDKELRFTPHSLHKPLSLCPLEQIMEEERFKALGVKHVCGQRLEEEKEQSE